MNDHQQNGGDSEKLEDAIVEYFELIDQGQAVNVSEFISSRSDIAADLQEFFETASLVESMAGPRLSDHISVLDPGETAGTGVRDTKIRRRPQLRVPSQFGRYRIESELGHGAMGSVYLAYDTQLARKVAVKIPVFDELEEPEMIERFYREARAAAMLRSPGICPVFDVDKIDEMHFIAMAFIEGQSLADWIKHSSGSLRDIAEIIRKLAIALQKAHDHGVIHRDLKPSNVMIDSDGEPVVMDFGLARQVGQTDAGSMHGRTIDGGSIDDGAIVGSPAYMSPEQVISDTDSVGPASDVYSLGVILYEMLCKRLPFRGSVVSIVGQIVAEDPQPPNTYHPGIDPRLVAICSRMMAKRIDDRYRCMDEVATAMSQFLEQSGPPPIVAQLTPVALQPVDAAGLGNTSPLAPLVKDIPQSDLGQHPSAQANRNGQVESHSRRVAGLVWGVTICLIGLALVVGLVVAALLRSDNIGSEPTVAQEANQESAAQTGGSNQSGKASDRGGHDKRSVEANGGAANAPGNATRIPAMRYNMRQGETFGYDIEATSTFGSQRESLNGTLTYRVLEADRNKIRLAFSSQMSAKSGRTTPGLERLYPFPHLADFVAVCPQVELTVGPSGALLDGGCRKPLPFGLGDLSRFMLEPLPLGRKARWQTNLPRVISVPDAKGPFRFSPLHRPPLVDTTVRVNSQYEAQGDKQELHVKKTFGLAPLEGQQKIIGDGSFLFHRKRGVIQQSQTNVNFTDRFGQTVRVVVKCRLLSEEELKRRLDARVAVEAITKKHHEHLHALTKAPDPVPGRAVTAETPLKVGDEIQAYRMQKWRDVKVLEVLDDGRVKVHWIGFGSELDQVLDRTRLRLWNNN